MTTSLLRLSRLLRSAASCRSLWIAVSLDLDLLQLSIRGQNPRFLQFSTLPVIEDFQPLSRLREHRSIRRLGICSRSGDSPIVVDAQDERHRNIDRASSIQTLGLFDAVAVG